MSRKPARLQRREFLKSTLSAAGAAVAAPMIVPASALGLQGTVPPSERVIVGGIGIGNRGTYDLGCFLEQGDVQFTAVCDMPPPDGIAPKNAPARLPAPVASSSRFARGSGSSLAWKARPTAIVSVKLISAMPHAPGHICRASDSSGRVRCGNPLGTAPTRSIPRLCQPSSAAPAIAAATAISGAGQRGRGLTTRGSQGRQSGRNRRKTVPTPDSLVISMKPLCDRTVQSTIASPRPLPSVGPFVVKNGSKTRS